MPINGAFQIPPDHPCLAGHFPDHPLVPGVVLLAEVLAIIQAPGRTAALDAVKFLAPVLPGQDVVVQATIADGIARFTATVGATRVLSGMLRFAA